MALALILKDHYGQNAVAMSWKFNLPQPLAMVAEASDFIILMQEHFLRYIPETYHRKVRVLDVGPDRWGNPMNRELLGIVSGAVEDWKRRDWKI